MSQSGRSKPSVGRPAAPPAYRPQPVPKVLQQKAVPSQKIISQKIAASAQKSSQAPPVYRPQPPPKVLQRKTVVASSPIPATRPTPAAPAAYRPNPAPKVLQAKMVSPPVNAVHTRGLQSLPAPHTGLSQHFGAIQLSGRKGGKGKPTPQTTKSGKMTKKATQKAKEKQEREEEKAKAKLEAQKQKEWKEKKSLSQKNELTKRWEADKDLINAYKSGISVSPPNTIAPQHPIPIVDLTDIRKENFHLADRLESSLKTIRKRPDTPVHKNREGKLPGYDSSVFPAAYLEYSFCGGGGRLIVDAINGIVYISLHYSRFSKLTINGHPPQEVLNIAALDRAEELEQLTFEEEKEPLGNPEEEKKPVANVEEEKDFMGMHMPPDSSLVSSSSSSIIISPRGRSKSPSTLRRSVSPPPELHRLNPLTTTTSSPTKELSSPSVVPQSSQQSPTNVSSRSSYRSTVRIRPRSPSPPPPLKPDKT